MAINLDDNVRVGQQKPLDSKYFNNLVPYSSTTEVNTLIPTAQRYRGLAVNVNGVEYWYKDGITNGNLVTKGSDLNSVLAAGNTATNKTMKLQNNSGLNSTQYAADSLGVFSDIENDKSSILMKYDRIRYEKYDDIVGGVTAKIEMSVSPNSGATDANEYQIYIPRKEGTLALTTDLGLYIGSTEDYDGENGIFGGTDDNRTIAFYNEDFIIEPGNNPNVEEVFSVIRLSDGVRAQLANEPTGLEAIDEGGGIGWRLIGRDPEFYAPIGGDAIDFSTSDTSGSTFGASGYQSFAMGSNVKARNYGSIAFGAVIDTNAVCDFNAGLNLKNAGYSNSLFGVGHDVTGLNVTVVGQGAQIINRQILDYNAEPVKELFVVGNGTIQNADSAFTVLTRSNAFQVHQNGLVYAPSLTNAGITSASGTVLTTKDYLDLRLSGIVGGGGYISLSGTSVGNPVTGNIELSGTSRTIFNGNMSGAISAIQLGPLSSFLYTLGVDGFGSEIDTYADKIILRSNNVVTQTNIVLEPGLCTLNEADMILNGHLQMGSLTSQDKMIFTGYSAGTDNFGSGFRFNKSGATVTLFNSNDYTSMTADNTTFKLTTTDAEIFVKSGATTSQGLKANRDFSAHITDFAYPQKIYVDNLNKWTSVSGASGTTSIYNNNTGNVGIGTTAPLAKFTIKTPIGYGNSNALFSIRDEANNQKFYVRGDGVALGEAAIFNNFSVPENDGGFSDSNSFSTTLKPMNSGGIRFWEISKRIDEVNDQSSTYTNNSLVNKAYVEGQIDAIALRGNVINLNYASTTAGTYAISPIDLGKNGNVTYVVDCTGGNIILSAVNSLMINSTIKIIRKDVSGNTLNFTPPSSTINGLSTLLIASNYTGAIIECDGAHFYKL